MRKTFAGLADRLVGLVLPSAIAGACACFPGDRTTVCCSPRGYWACKSCQLNCYCNPINCGACICTTACKQC